MNPDFKSSLNSISILLNNSEINWQDVLLETLKYFDCSTGTIHFLDKKTSLLHIKAHQGIPTFVVPKLSIIPIGKGMAGIAAQRKEAVEMCNLQTDDSGVARPAAKETKVEGSLAAPMLLNNILFGTIGIAKPISYDFTKKEIKELLEIGNKISSTLQKF